jgi:hypothetical protein
MKRLAVTSLLLVMGAIATTAGAAADGGGPSPGVEWGWRGVVSPNGQVRYVAIPSSRDTVVAAVRVHGGRVLRWTSIPGTYGVPRVTLFGAPSGLSRDGKTLVLASQSAAPGHNLQTRFAVLNTRTLQLQPATSLRARPVIILRGSFSFDAVSPDGSTLYLIQYTSAQDYNRYRVRAYDIAQEQLVPGAIVDKREPDEAMAGSPVDRATTAGGRWAYTLYARQGDAPFVHALDTVKREAYCIDLPLHMSQQRQMRLRLALHGATELRVHAGRKTVAVVDMEKLEARTVG